MGRLPGNWIIEGTVSIDMLQIITGGYSPDEFIVWYSGCHGNVSCLIPVGENACCIKSWTVDEYELSKLEPACVGGGSSALESPVWLNTEV